MTDSFETLRIEKSGFVTTLTLCRAELLNRFDGDAHTEFLHAIDIMAEDNECRAILIEAEGKVFSAGGDLNEVARMQADDAHRARMFREARQLVRGLLALEPPIVAAVHGDAIGLGATIVVLCDMIVASRNAGICDPHVAIGLAAGDGGCIGWPSAMGLMRAKRYLLTGERIDAETAYHAGLVTDIVETPDEARDAARALAAKIASLAPIAVKGTKRALNAYALSTFYPAFELSCVAEDQSAVSDDVVEGVTAFREKRKPKFKGR
jgi:enoyl-CoA hydratase/carnithine racemase